MIQKSYIAFLLVASCLMFLVSTCTKDKGKLNNGYPDEINKILVTKCATQGCHTTASKEAAAGLAMETWDQLFEGGHGGAACIPYSHDYSLIWLFTNTDSTKGAVNMPTMPYNSAPLSAAEMKTLTDWIDQGAPSSDGKIAFADNPNRKKFYVTNQGCDVVTVFDAATLLQMRYIKVGSGTDISPHMIKIAPDGKYWYTCFYIGSVFQKFNTSDDSYAGAINIGNGCWNTFALSNDSKKAFVVDWAPDGNIAYVDLDNMNMISKWGGSQFFINPHGSAINSNGDTLYVGANSGNCIYKVPVNNVDDPKISIDPPQIGNAVNDAIKAHDIAWSPDSTTYFVTCEKTNDVRAFLRSNDSMIAKIPVGNDPVEMSFSTNPNTPYLFVTCMYDTMYAGPRGAVAVINYQNLAQSPIIIKGANIAEPHGIGVDDATGLVYVANRNITGPLPHHSTNCGGKIGFVSFIDINTLKLLPFKREIANNPYSIAVRK